MKNWPRSWFLWMALAFVILSVAFVMRSLIVERELRRIDDLNCRYTVFTRQTQRGVLDYILAQSEKGSQLAIDPRLKRFYATQLPILRRLSKRTSPPPKCQ